jgi:hypothetical protein
MEKRKIPTLAGNRNPSLARRVVTILAGLHWLLNIVFERVKTVHALDRAATVIDIAVYMAQLNNHNN